MTRLRAIATMPPVEVDLVLGLLPALARAWRALRFENGVYVDPDGRCREGLRIDRGVHPVPGVRYRVVLQDEVPTQPTQAARLEVELVADDSDAIRVRADGPEVGDLQAEAELRRPHRPDQLRLEATAATGTGWLAGGRVSAEATVQLDQIPATAIGHDDRQITVRAMHRRAAGVAVVGIRDLGDAWEVTLELTLRGRGWVWPIAVVLGPWLKRRLRSDIDELIQLLPEAVEELNRELTTGLGADRDLDRYATKLLHDALATAVVE